jgi:methyl-accepting chemotaxis protein
VEKPGTRRHCGIHKQLNDNLEQIAVLPSFRSITIKTKLLILAGLFAAAFVSFGVFCIRMCNTIRVNGPVYQEIIQGKDIVADILPPPLYIVEAYLTVHQMVSETDAGKQRKLVARYRRLQAEYEERRQFWQKSLDEGDLKRLLVDESFTPAREFFDLTDKKLLPALAKGDRRSATQILYASLNPKYEQHRSQIDRVVTLSNGRNEAKEKEASQYVRLRLQWIVGAGLGVVIGVVGISLILSQSITCAIGTAVKLLGQVAKGNLGIEIPQSLSDRHDEAGILANSIQTMTTSLRETVESLSDNARRLASSSVELTATATQLAGSAQETTAQSSTVASATEELSTNMSNMSATGEQMTTNVKVVASAVEEINVSIAEVAKNAQEAAAIARGAVKLAADSNKCIGELGAAAEKVGKVTDVIQEIAEQTNLLALNATIEAARAGEAGKGFSVVANEVKALARQTAAATEDIRHQIEWIQGTTGQAVQAIGGVGNVIQKIDDLSRLIATTVEQQSITTREIARNVVQASAAVEMMAGGVSEAAVLSRDISQNIAGVATAAQNTASAAGTTHEASVGLADTTRELRAIMSRYTLDNSTGEVPATHSGPKAGQV